MLRTVIDILKEFSIIYYYHYILIILSLEEGKNKNGTDKKGGRGGYKEKQQFMKRKDQLRRKYLVEIWQYGIRMLIVIFSI